MGNARCLDMTAVTDSSSLTCVASPSNPPEQLSATVSTQLSVVLLLASDADRTAEFYRELLKIPLVAERHDGRHTHYACRLGSVYFTIQPRTDLGEPPATGYDSLQLCFTTPDMVDFLKHLKDRQVDPLHPPRP